MSGKFERLPHETLYESVIRWLKSECQSAEAGGQGKVGKVSPLAGLSGGPQPAVRLLDECEDLSNADMAQEFTKFPRRERVDSGNLAEQCEVGRSRPDNSTIRQAGAKAPEVNPQNPDVHITAESLGAGRGIRPAGNSLAGAANLRREEAKASAAPEADFAYKSLLFLAALEHARIEQQFRAWVKRPCKHEIPADQECWKCDYEDYLQTGMVHGLEDA